MNTDFKPDGEYEKARTAPRDTRPDAIVTDGDGNVLKTFTKGGEWLSNVPPLRVSVAIEVLSLLRGGGRVSTPPACGGLEGLAIDVLTSYLKEGV